MELHFSDNNIRIVSPSSSLEFGERMKRPLTEEEIASFVAAIDQHKPVLDHLSSASLEDMLVAYETIGDIHAHIVQRQQFPANKVIAVAAFSPLF